MLDAEDIRDRIGFDAPIALLTSIAAEIDPCQTTHRLLAKFLKMGGRVRSHYAG
ncbi:MAG: hypothetical protein ABI748_00295 [Dokdonella sp.]